MRDLAVIAMHAIFASIFAYICCSSLFPLCSQINAIRNYGGGLLFVSHDQNFLQSVGRSASHTRTKRALLTESTKAVEEDVRAVIPLTISRLCVCAVCVCVCVYAANSGV